jgi:hypothetical protein
MRPERSRSRTATTWLVLLISIAFMALVIYRSLHAAGYRCEICITFDGRAACRTVDGPTELEARASAINNTCAQIASGVTDSMACERTTPTRAHCEPIL